MAIGEKDKRGRCGDCRHFVDDPAVLADRQALLAHPQVRGLIERAALVDSLPFKRHNDAAHPLYALTTLADTAVAMAIKSLLPPGTRFATTELTTRFLAPVRCGRVTARAVVQGPQGRTFAGKAQVMDDHGTEVAIFTCTFRVARGQGYDD